MSRASAVLGSSGFQALAVLAASLLGLAGCGSETGGVPPANDSVLPPTLREQKPLTFGVVMPRQGIPEVAYYETYLRAYSSRENVILAVEHSEPGRQDEAIETLTMEPLSALLVVPDPEKPPIETLKKLRGEGLPVVVVGRSIEIEPPIPTVKLQPLKVPSAKIVEALLEDVKKAGFADDAPAVILKARHMRVSGRERAEAFRQALESASRTVLPDVPFEASDPTNATEAIQAVRKEHEDLAMILSIEEQGVLGAVEVSRSQPEGEKPVAVGGYFEMRELLNSPLDPMISAVGDLDHRKVCEKAVQTGLQLARGETAPTLSEIEVAVIQPESDVNNTLIRGLANEPPAPKVSEEPKGQ